MTSVLIAYDGTAAAVGATRTAGTLFPGAEATVLTVRSEPIPAHAESAARIGMPNSAIVGGVQALQLAATEAAATVAADGTALARANGLSATERVVNGAGAVWPAIAAAAAGVRADVIACGSRGLGWPSRLALGSTSSGLLYHADRPLLIVRRFVHDGPAVIGYDGSRHARDAIAVTANLLGGGDVIVVTAWESVVRHSLGGRALASVPTEQIRAFARDLDAYYRDVAADIAEEGASLAREHGLGATAAQTEGAGSSWHALLEFARGAGAALIVVAARGRGGVTSAVLGSVSSGLAHNAELPVLVVRSAVNPGSESGPPADGGGPRRP